LGDAGARKKKGATEKNNGKIFSKGGRVKTVDNKRNPTEGSWGRGGKTRVKTVKKVVGTGKKKKGGGKNTITLLTQP